MEEEKAEGKATCRRESEEVFAKHMLYLGTMHIFSILIISLKISYNYVYFIKIKWRLRKAHPPVQDPITRNRWCWSCNPGYVVDE